MKVSEILKRVKEEGIGSIEFPFTYTKHSVRKQKGAGKLQSQKGEVPPGADPAEFEGWEPLAWKHNALRHSFISYRVAKVSLEAGNSPRMVFSNYRGPSHLVQYPPNSHGCRNAPSKPDAT